MRVLSIFGTRPEAIKIAPVIREFAKDPSRFESRTCVTAQHREMLDQVLGLFDIEPDIDLDLMEKEQSLASFAGKAIAAISGALEKIRPHLVLVQGDTTTAMVGGLASHYQKIPVGHVEAGLRTHSRYQPFPEEMNRHLLGSLASYHFAPTESAREALLSEGVPESSIFVTGNTVIDALLWVSSQPPSAGALEFLESIGHEREGEVSREGLRTVLVTVHRRESFGETLDGICGALKSLARRNSGIQIVYPVHRNPNVKNVVYRVLADEPRIHLVDPLPYEIFVHLMNRSYLILTDSGGLQEEGPALGRPVLVLRDKTERPEGVEAGTAKMVGTDPESILNEAERLLNNSSAYEQMACAVSPYGDGHAARRIVEAVAQNFPEEFSG